MGRSSSTASHGGSTNGPPVWRGVATPTRGRSSPETQKHAKQEELRAAVLDSLSAGEEISKRTLRDRVPGDNTIVSKVISELVEEGALHRRIEGQTHFISIP